MKSSDWHCRHLHQLAKPTPNTACRYFLGINTDAVEIGLGTAKGAGKKAFDCPRWLVNDTNVAHFKNEHILPIFVT